MRSPRISPDFREGDPGDPNPAGTGLKRGREEGSGPAAIPGTGAGRAKCRCPALPSGARGCHPRGSLRKAGENIGKAGGITTEQKSGVLPQRWSQSGKWLLLG